MEEAPTLNFSAIYELFVSMHLVFCSAQIKEAAFSEKYMPSNLHEHHGMMNIFLLWYVGCLSQ